jgi:hypothetical protein
MAVEGETKGHREMPKVLPMTFIKHILWYMLCLKQIVTMYARELKLPSAITQYVEANIDRGTYTQRPDNQTLHDISLDLFYPSRRVGH